MKTTAALVELRWLLAGLALLGATARAAAQDEPPLPQGLTTSRPADAEPPLPEGLTGQAPDDDEQEPSLPEGLAPSPPAGQEPALPPGLEAPPPAAKKPPEKADVLGWLGLTGFWEVRGGVRTQHDRYEKQASAGETRLQLKFEKPWEKLVVKLTADLLYDAVLEHHSVDLERGRGFLDLREASATLTPLSFMDVKIGRQILTWGTGDLLFINDLFPKDWQSFFIGRDAEYLKAPSDAVKIGIFTELANLNLVYTPRFDPDRFIRGERISYWNGLLGRRSGRDAVVDSRLPDDCFKDSEFAGRLSRTVKGYELAAYGYVGYWKSPAGTDPRSFEATFPRLSVYGASVRGPAGGGIANLEAGYYDSRQDRSGDDPFVRNSELRILAGYERDLPRIAKDLTLGVQYYLEYMMEYGAYRRSLPPGMRPADEGRHVVTVRLTKLLMNQNLKCSLFAYFSPTDLDAYLRPNVQYKIDDHWTAEVGGNVFFGEQPHTFFSQFANNTNLYAALRYGF